MPEAHSCPNQECPTFGNPGNGNIFLAKIYGKRRTKLYRCKICNRTFSERRSSTFYGFHKEEEIILQAFAFLASGKSIRDTARVIGVDKDTICRWLDRAQDHPARISTVLSSNGHHTLVHDFLEYLHRRKGNRTNGSNGNHREIPLTLQENTA